MKGDAFYEAQYELRKAEVNDYIKRTDDEFTAFIIRRHKHMLQELLCGTAGPYDHRQRLLEIAGHYSTLQMCGDTVILPDEVMAMLILERLV